MDSQETEPPRFMLSCAGATDVGAVRKLNEDAWIARPEIGLWAVADGMGGHAAGDLASRTIIAALAEIEPPEHARDLAAGVHAAILAANDALVAESARRGPGTVIGATVVALMIQGGHFACLWAGDSRLYRFRDGALAQLSRDHSQVQDMVDTGIITAQDAERHPLANVITRAVGAAPMLQLDGITDALRDGDIVLVCSDGLSKMVPDPAIAAILAEGDLATRPDALIAAALAQGGTDNVTAIVVQARAAESA